MNTTRMFAAVAVLSTALLPAASAHADEARTTSTIAVDVGTFRNDKGFLGCALFTTAASFPNSSGGAVRQRVAIAGKVVRCTFENVQPGTYAVAVIHDENGNGKLDTSFLGVPSEGYGVSNNHTHAMSAPKWDESKFVVERGKDVRLGIGLRY